MKKKTSHKHKIVSDMRAEYQFDYSKSRPNRFAKKDACDNLIILDPDVSKVFTTSESVNKVLRALIGTMPKNSKRKSMLQPE
jgi:hypothetical protein